MYKRIIIYICLGFIFSIMGYAQNTTTYQYDSHNRLSNSSDDNTSIQYSFDQLGNRIQYNLTSQSPSQADLVVENISIPTNTLEQGTNILVSCDVSNIGTSNADGSYLKVYLSNTATGVDTELKSRYISTVVSGGSESLSFNITIPQTAAVGNKYLVFFADATAIVTESNENNNKSNVAVTIIASTLPDLTIQNQQINPTSLLAGANTIVTANIMNTGNASANNFWVRCYLSLNPTFEVFSDSELTDAAFSITSLNAATTIPYYEDVNIPLNTVPGNYYLLFVVDPENTVTEQDEENNVVYSTISILSQSGGNSPVANFLADNQYIEEGATVQFTDVSTNNPTSWQWSFPGGTPAYSTSQNPSITYDSGGSFNVSLTTSNTVGSDTKIDSSFITVGLVSLLALQDITINNGQTECFNATSTITIAGSETTVDIQSGGEATFIAGETIYLMPGFHSYSGSTTHAYITTTGDYCSSQESMISSPDIVNDLSELIADEEARVNIYPNPTTGNFTIDFMGEATTADILLLNFQGATLLEQKCKDQMKTDLDISYLSEGMYIIVIKTKTEIITKKIIKKY